MIQIPVQYIRISDASITMSSKATHSTVHSARTYYTGTFRLVTCGTKKVCSFCLQYRSSPNLGSRDTRLISGAMPSPFGSIPAIWANMLAGISVPFTLTNLICSTLCVCAAHAVPQLQTHGEWNPLHGQPRRVHSCLPGAGLWSVAACLQLHRSFHAPSATMKKKLLHLHPGFMHLKRLPSHLCTFLRHPHKHRDSPRMGMHD